MHVPVLIVGGGPIGLTASVLLSQFGIESLLVNQRPTTSTHPRARFIDVRTTEILRQMGLADEVLATGLPREWVDSVRYSRSLSEPEIHRLPTASYDCEPRDWSPTVPIMSAQDLVEPIMLEAARSYDTASVRFGTELIAIGHDDEACRATLRDLASGDEMEVSADFVIGADGRRSSVRRLLGGDLDVGFTQSGSIQDVLYHADMSRWVGDRTGALLFVMHERGYGLFQPMDGVTRWQAQCTTFTPPIAAADVTEADCVEWIRSAIGDTDGELEIDVEGIAPWTPEARLSDDFRRGRVVLAGDAAHMLYPTGGLGMNLGYHGIHNLVWKLAFVLRGLAADGLLETYEIERRPQADRTRNTSVENARLAGDLYRTYLTGGDVDEAAHRLRQYGNFEGLILAPEYMSSLCRTESERGPEVENDLVDFVPCVRAGRRAPHVWLDATRTVSVLDHFGAEYVLLATAGSPSERSARARERRAAGFPIRTEQLPETVVGDLYASGEDVLVRPDGIVAARLAHNEHVDFASLLPR
ncbi:MAG: FAD-dependent monooxygenase [Actinomycetota bacterium]